MINDIKISGQLCGLSTHNSENTAADPPIQIKFIDLLHIMCGYQCDKAVNKSDTREVISLHGLELSNQTDGNNLAGPIGFNVIFKILADAWRQIWREELLWRELLCSFINAFLYFNLVA